ncbi:MAG: sodium:proton antiporter NhaD [Campylobacterales bacterium]
MEQLTNSWVGWVVLGIFSISYLMIALEEKFEINKSKPALFAGTFSFILIGLYFWVNHLPLGELRIELSRLILEVAEIFFFLFVAMTFVETMIDRKVFDALKYQLTSRGYSYKKLFWLTGLIAFFLSPVADNLTTALILATVIYTIDKNLKSFLVPSAINIVVAANAGGAWSPFGDITTLMVWTAGKGEFFDFLALFPASFLNWVVTAFLLSLFIPKGEPHFDSSLPPVKIAPGGKAVIGIGVFTIVTSVLLHIFLHFPAMWGMMFGLSILQFYVYFAKRRWVNEKLDIHLNMKKVEHDTLLFFFGILSSVGALAFLGWLHYIVKLYSKVGETWANIGVGFISAIIDNVPVMSAILKAGLQMDDAQWMLVTFTAGVGGSLISFGSAAGVGVMGRLRGIYTFQSHLKFGWTVLAGYIVGIIVWYLQFEVLGLY